MTKGLVPREHGSYVVLATSLALGVLTSDAPQTVPTLLACTAAVGGFFAQQPLRTMLKLRRAGRREPAVVRTAAFALVVLVLVSLALLIPTRPQVLVVLGASIAIGGALLLSDVRRLSMTGQSMLGFAGLTMAAPLVQIAGDTSTAFVGSAVLWAALAAFFIASALSVRIRLEPAAGHALALGFHFAFLAGSILALSTGLTALPFAMAVLACAKLAYVLAAIESYRRLTLRTIGLIETAAALVLVIVAITL